MTETQKVMSTGIKKVWMEKLEQVINTLPHDNAERIELTRLRAAMANPEYVVGLAVTFKPEDTLGTKRPFVDMLVSASQRIRTYLNATAGGRRTSTYKLEEVRSDLDKLAAELRHPSYVMTVDLGWDERGKLYDWD